MTNSELDSLAAGFLTCTIPRAEWTHAAHLAVGMWHVYRYREPEALGLLRIGIRRLNDSHGTPNTSTGGYHETITRAYVSLLSAFSSGLPVEMSLAERVTHLLTAPLADKDALLRFYSLERLMFPRARAQWVEPDIAPLRVSTIPGSEIEHDP